MLFKTDVNDNLIKRKHQKSQNDCGKECEYSLGLEKYNYVVLTHLEDYVKILPLAVGSCETDL